jgi:choline dehydrogenase-like flavoprotein
MCCDASVIPNDIAANPMATVMAIAGRAAEFVVSQVLGKTLKPADRAQSLVTDEVTP